MKTPLLTIALLLTVLFPAACSEDNAYDLQPGFGAGAGYEPAGIAGWPHALFCFSGETCTDILAADNRASLGRISTDSPRATLVAYSSAGNLRFSSMQPGSGAYDYTLQIEDIDAEIPQVWIQCTSLKNAAGGFRLKPLTASLTVNLTAAAPNLRSVELKLPRQTDAVYLKTGVPEPLGEAQTKTVRVTDPGQQFNLFPMVASDRKWALPFTVCFDDPDEGEQRFEGELTIPHGVGSGQAVEIDFDFSKQSADGTYTVAYRESEYGAGAGTVAASSRYYLARNDYTYKDDNAYYNVYVLQDACWKSLKVHNALCSDAPSHHTEFWNDWDNSKKLRDTMCYVLFTDDFDGPVRMRVEKRSRFGSVQIRPSDYAVATDPAGENTVEFTLPGWEKRKVSVEFDGDRYHNLFILPARPDAAKPSASDAGVLYYGPGEHTETEIITLTEGQTLYVDEGATLYPKQIRIEGSNTAIAGRGIISGEKMLHWGENYSNSDIMIEVNVVDGAIGPDQKRNLRIEGVTFVDSPSWLMRICNTDKVAIDGVNAINWCLNGDCIDLYGVTDATIRDCMLRTYDDCITIKVSDWHINSGIRISDCLVWTDGARGIVIGPECGHEGSQSWGRQTGVENVTVDNCTVLEASRSEAGNKTSGYGLAIMQGYIPRYYGTPTDFRNITFSNCRVDNIHPSGTPVLIFQQENQGRTWDWDTRCIMEGVVFSNVSVYAPRGSQPLQAVADYNYMTFKFDNVTYNDAKIMSAGANLTLSQLTDDGEQHIFATFQ